jgi:hypothetical protein
VKEDEEYKQCGKAEELDKEVEVEDGNKEKEENKM